MGFFEEFHVKRADFNFREKGRGGIDLVNIFLFLQDDLGMVPKIIMLIF